VTRRRRLVALASLVAGVAVLVLSEPVHDVVLRVLGYAHTLAAGNLWLAAAVVVTFAALGAMIAFVSSWIVLPFAVYTWGPVQALLLLWLGWLLGGVATYSVGRFIGRPAVGWLASPNVLAQYEKRISRRSTFGLILLLQLGLPSEIPGYVLGLVRYPFGWYLAALSLAELLHGIPAVYLGAGLVERQAALVVGVVAVMIALTLVAAYGLRRRLIPARAVEPVVEQPTEAAAPSGA